MTVALPAASICPVCYRQIGAYAGPDQYGGESGRGRRLYAHAFRGAPSLYLREGDPCPGSDVDPDEIPRYSGTSLEFWAGVDQYG